MEKVTFEHLKKKSNMLHHLKRKKNTCEKNKTLHIFTSFLLLFTWN